MAASVAGYLEAWQSGNQHARIILPEGQFAAAERFFNHVLQGTALDRGQRIDPEAPTMAGISNLTIAVEVLAALPCSRPPQTEEVEKTVQSYLTCLKAICEGASVATVDVSIVESLRAFLRELQRQGNLAHHVAFAADESPLR
jgi:hypothetical protein